MRRRRRSSRRRRTCVLVDVTKQRILELAIHAAGVIVTGNNSFVSENSSFVIVIINFSINSNFTHGYHKSARGLE